MSDMASKSTQLRVAFIVSSLSIGGAEKQTVYMARALREAGVDVRLFYLGSGGYYEAVVRQMGVTVRQIHHANKPWFTLARLTRSLRRFRPHVIMVSQFGDLVYGIPAGWCCHALTLGGIRSDGSYELNVRGKLSPWLFRVGDGFIANSYRATRNLAGRGFKPRKIKILPNVIDLEDFDARIALPLDFSLPSERLIVAAVGSLQPCKRLDRFVEALALARRDIPKLFGVIAGADRGIKHTLEERASALGLMPEHLRFVGEIDRVPSLLARAHLLVLSSDYEGFPNVILEAMAARLPVISTPAGDAAVIVQNGKTGYVTGMDDVKGMAAFMIQLAGSSVLREELGEAARKRVEQEYNYESLANRLMGAFHQFAREQRNAHLLEVLEHRISATKTGRWAESMALVSLQRDSPPETCNP
jgi:glycosyltransferase involved in cell wall biosynthesis